MLDWDEPSTWDDAYQTRRHVADAYEPVILRYHRQVMWHTLERQAEGLMRLLKLDAGSKIILVGAAYGWTAEILKQMLPGIVVICTDTSVLVHSRKHLTEQAEIEYQLEKAGGSLTWVQDFQDFKPRSREIIFNEDLKTPASRAIMRQGLSIDWIVSESVIDCLEDVAVLELAENMRLVTCKVAHLTTSPRNGRDRPPGYNWKTAEGWKEFLGTDRIIPTGDFRTIL